jgi:threonine dehydrogenase-like Zn-dependent dehydrogenase
VPGSTPSTQSNALHRSAAAVTYRSGRCPARYYMEKLLPVVRERRFDFTSVFTHRLPLSQGVEGYAMFDEKRDGCIKVVLDPWAE